MEWAIGVAHESLNLCVPAWVLFSENTTYHIGKTLQKLYFFHGCSGPSALRSPRMKPRFGRILTTGSQHIPADLPKVVLHMSRNPSLEQRMIICCPYRTPMLWQLRSAKRHFQKKEAEVKQEWVSEMCCHATGVCVNFSQSCHCDKSVS